MGRVHSNHYRHLPHVKLAAYDANPEALDAFCSNYSVTACHSLDELFDHSDVVDVCLPTDLHYEIGLKAIAAGKHVLLEKPMARTTQECRELLQAAREAKVQLAPGHVVRYFADYERAHNLVVSGAIGRPGAARCRRGGKAPVGSAGWFRDATRSGGVLLDLAVHEFDWLSWTLGDVTSVMAQSVAFSGQEAVGDYGLATLTHAGGAVSHVEATWMDPAGFRMTFEVCGSEGMIQYDSRTSVAVRTSNEKGTFTDNNLAGNQDPYFRQLSTWVSCVQSGEPYAVRPEDGFKAVAIAEAALQSAQAGKVVVPATL